MLGSRSSARVRRSLEADYMAGKTTEPRTGKTSYNGPATLAPSTGVCFHSPPGSSGTRVQSLKPPALLHTPLDPQVVNVWRYHSSA